MAKKPSAFAPQWERPFDPVLVHDPHAVVRGPWLGKWLLLGYTFEGFRAVGRQVHVDGVMPGVTHGVIMARDLKKYAIVDGENKSLQSVIAGIKIEMLTHGATPLAVQWIGELSSFTEKEYNIMADKLTKPVGKGGTLAKADKPKGGGKGNPAALAKAREAQAGKKADQMADKRKITLTDKGAEKVKKGGTSGAVQNLIAMKAAKTVGAAITGGLAMADINYAEKSETITVG
jgi:hypothetical protein